MDRFGEKAWDIVEEWRQDVRNGVPVDQWDMLNALIAQALRAEREAALEEAAKRVSCWSPSLPKKRLEMLAYLADAIRSLKGSK